MESFCGYKFRISSLFQQYVAEWLVLNGLANETG